MTVEVPVTVVGNIVSDPELRFTPSGKAVADFRVAENHKRYSQETKKWETTNTTFYRVNAWGDQASNIAGALQKGTEVVVVGKFQAREYETKDGDKRLSLEISVSYGSGVVAPVVSMFQQVEVTRERSNNGSSSADTQSSGSWAAQPAQSAGHNWASAPAVDGDNPPF